MASKKTMVTTANVIPDNKDAKRRITQSYWSVHLKE